MPSLLSNLQRDSEIIYGRTFEDNYVMPPNEKAVIRLRSLYTRGRATTADPVMKFICELGDNGVVWNVLSFWRGGRASLY